MSVDMPHTDDFQAAYAGQIEFQPLDATIGETTAEIRNQRQEEIRETLTEKLYGKIPPPPDSIKVSRQAMKDERAERLLIEIEVDGGRFTVDAALWLPQNTNGPVPLICGLDFAGPVGIMNSTEFPIDAKARVSSQPIYGAKNNRMEETLRGSTSFRWPIDLMLNAGHAVLVSCYGSWVPDDANEWKGHGLYPFLGCPDASTTGAISLWAWAIQRLLDAAESFDEIDMSKVSVAGHSRLGKAALWAAANDTRIGTVLANNSGCGGAAPAAHPVGETFAQMAERFPHWTLPSHRQQSLDLTFDQHHLVSLIAPRSVYLAQAKEDLWADPLGSYMVLQEAAEFWKPEQKSAYKWPLPREIWQTGGQVLNGRLGYHLRPGGHTILPYDWRQFLAFLDTK